MYDVYDAVYYYDEDSITGLEYQYNYESEDDAKSATDYINLTLDESNAVEKVERKGKQVVITFKKEKYQDLTTTSVRELCASMKKNDNASGE